MAKKKIDFVEILNIALKLTIICFSAVVLLLIIHLITAPIIKKNKEKYEKQANQKLIPDGTDFILKEFGNIDKELKKIYYYYEVKNNNMLIGYIISSVGKGYGGSMKVLVAVDPELKILDIKLLDNAETPGLGKKAEKTRYMKKFKGTNAEGKPLPTDKSMLSPEEANAITGATITFNGVVNGIQAALNLMKEELNK